MAALVVFSGSGMCVAGIPGHDLSCCVPFCGRHAQDASASWSVWIRRTVRRLSISTAVSGWSCRWRFFSAKCFLQYASDADASASIVGMDQKDSSLRYCFRILLKKLTLSTCRWTLVFQRNAWFDSGFMLMRQTTEFLVWKWPFSPSTLAVACARRVCWLRRTPRCVPLIVGFRRQQWLLSTAGFAGDDVHHDRLQAF